MKLVLALGLASFVGGTAQAYDASCTATEVHDTSYLEESLSVEEYPEVTVSSDEVGLGASVYSINDGDQILLRPSVGFKTTIEVVHASGEVSFFININNGPGGKTGTLWGQNKGEESSLIADLVCD